MRMPENMPDRGHGKDHINHKDGTKKWKHLLQQRHTNLPPTVIIRICICGASVFSPYYSRTGYITIMEIKKQYPPLTFCFHGGNIFTKGG